jgi:hypothetical protein
MGVNSQLDAVGAVSLQKESLRYLLDAWLGEFQSLYVHGGSKEKSVPIKNRNIVILPIESHKKRYLLLHFTLFPRKCFCIM